MEGVEMFKFIVNPKIHLGTYILHHESHSRCHCNIQLHFRLPLFRPPIGRTF